MIAYFFMLCAPELPARDLAPEPVAVAWSGEDPAAGLSASMPTDSPSAEPEPAPVHSSDPAATPVQTDGEVLVDDAVESNTKTESKNKSKSRGPVEFGGRVMAGWEYDDKRPTPALGMPSTDKEFFLRQARLSAGIFHKDVFRLKFGLELADAFDGPANTGVRYLRNAYANARVNDALQFRVGHFKRPFSRLELRGPGDLPVRGRGLTNGRLLEDRNYGDRSVGGMVWGKIKTTGLRWYAGAFAADSRKNGVDAIGRLQFRATPWLSVGASGGYKRIENGLGDPVQVGSANFDFRIKVAGLYLLADFVAGQDYLVLGEPWAVGTVAYASYDIPVARRLVLQPALLGEWSDANIEFAENDAIRAVAGVNLIWRKRYRLMPQADFRRRRGETGTPWIDRDTYYLMVSLEI